MIKEFPSTGENFLKITILVFYSVRLGQILSTSGFDI